MAEILEGATVERQLRIITSSFLTELPETEPRLAISTQPARITLPDEIPRGRDRRDSPFHVVRCILRRLQRSF